MRVQQQARGAELGGQFMDDEATQTENVRKMLLGFSRDLRVVLLRLASRLQTLRYYAASKRPVSPGIAREALTVFAPLANRLGIWQIKWELEDLSLRFLEPETYREVARLLDEKRVEREAYMEQMRARLEADLRAHSISATVQGRPKHIYSIVKKMRGKSLNFDQDFDIRAMRVIVPTIKDCYAALSWVHEQFTPIEAEFDDYIARPKPNGYQSLHTVVRDETGRAIEIQIRTQAMHDHAEHGVAAHWAYKEAGTKGYAGVTASSEYDAKIAVLRQLLAWGSDLAGAHHRGLTSNRAKAKVRAWFNAQATHETVARGREAVEKLLQREGKTSVKLEELATQLGFKSADALFEVVGKDEYSLRNIETVLRPVEVEEEPEEFTLVRKARGTDSPKGGVLVVGLDSLMTQLAKCCKPAPPDDIRGFVTRGKGVSVHRCDCSNFREMAARNAERVIDVEWGRPQLQAAAVYPVDVAVEASDRQGLLRDISEVFAREKTNVIGVQTQSVKGTAWMTFTVEVSDAGRLNKVLGIVGSVPGVRSARRR
jgi:(p)ppGpp synthase/HD superfamily hydrolase